MRPHPHCTVEEFGQFKSFKQNSSNSSLSSSLEKILSISLCPDLMALPTGCSSSPEELLRLLSVNLLRDSYIEDLKPAGVDCLRSYRVTFDLRYSCSCCSTDTRWG